MNERYLVIFTTPVDGGWATTNVEAVAVVTNIEGNMPYGWDPIQINGQDVSGIKYIILIHDGQDMPFVVAGEYDRQVPLAADTAIIIHDKVFAEMGVEDDLDRDDMPEPDAA